MQEEEKKRMVGKRAQTNPAKHRQHWERVQCKGECMERTRNGSMGCCGQWVAMQANKVRNGRNREKANLRRQCKRKGDKDEKIQRLVAKKASTGGMKSLTDKVVGGEMRRGDRKRKRGRRHPKVVGNSILQARTKEVAEKAGRGMLVVDSLSLRKRKTQNIFAQDLTLVSVGESGQLNYTRRRS